MDTLKQNIQTSSLEKISKLTDKEYELFRDLIYELAGIDMPESKRALIASRLSRRIRQLNCRNYSDYYKIVIQDPTRQEQRHLIDSLTTNETFFFREKPHFEFLRNYISSKKSIPDLKIWSAASSSGEEAYSIAMTLSDLLGPKKWSVLGTDINSEVLQRAAHGLYSMFRTDGIPEKYLKKYCLKGINEESGNLLISKAIRERVRFSSHNLLYQDPKLGQFDIVFLRNVLIYFDEKTKDRVISNVLRHLKPEGFLIIGLSDKFNRKQTNLEPLGNSVFRKPAVRAER